MSLWLGEIMMKKTTLYLSSLIGAGLLAATPAQASYMSKCEKLIKAWDVCMESSGSCEAETKAIEEQCKCHAQKGDEWKLIMAAVAKDNVCGKVDWPKDPPPDPSPPRQNDQSKADQGEHRHDGDAKPENRGDQ